MRRWKRWMIPLVLLVTVVPFVLAQTETFPRWRIAGALSGVVVEVNSAGRLLTTTTGTAAQADTGLASTLPRYRLAGGVTGNLAEVDATGHLLVAADSAGLGTTDTPQFAALGLGTTAPASGMTILSAANPCIAIGPNGTTTPMFSINCSVASAATGVLITPAASGSGVTMSATGGTNESMTLNGKGTGSVTIGNAGGNVTLNAVSTGTVGLAVNSGTKLAVTAKSSTWDLPARTSGTTAFIAITGATDTALTAATESFDINFDLSQTKQHASNTTVAMQRSVVISPPTLTFATNGGVFTEAASLAVVGPPTSDANNTITQSDGILVQSRALTGVTTGISLVANAPTGATTNYSAKFAPTNGVIFTPPATQTIAAGNTIAADACGGVKNITAAGAVATDTTNTFTAPAATNTGCSMMVCNIGTTNAITLDHNVLFFTVGGIDLVLLANSCVGVTQSTGTEWRQTSAQLTAS